MSSNRDISISDTPEQPQVPDIAISDHLIELRGFEVVPDAQYAPVYRLAPGSAEAQARQREIVERLGLPLEIKTKITDIRLRLMPPGKFMMGSPNAEKERYGNEQLHSVTFTQPFYIGAYEITQEQWRRVMGSNPSYFKEGGDNAPVECVSWHDCQLFIRKLEALERLAKDCLRLPTEAEWEYACRAGTQTAFCYGNRLDSTMANFDGKYPYGGAAKGVRRGKTMPVGSFKPNTWGLFDMHGNVYEWCMDLSDDDCVQDIAYGSVKEQRILGLEPNVNSRAYAIGFWIGFMERKAEILVKRSFMRLREACVSVSPAHHIVRGGAWNSSAASCRSAYRCRCNRDKYSTNLGLRLVLPVTL